jgi:hypothetical protein
MQPSSRAAGQLAISLETNHSILRERIVENFEEQLLGNN